MNLAPVVIFTFNRLEHTINTLNSLKNNELASESDVFIFSDGPRNEDERLKVNEVRNYLKTIDGFKYIKIIESNVNKGLAASVIEGVTSIINRYGKVIVLEDDLITSRYFLKYMNNALSLYEDKNDIWSISGYTPNIEIPRNYNKDIYFTYRGCSWGWATWKNRWNKNDWEIKDYLKFKKNKQLIKQFNKSGSDMMPMLNDQMNGMIDSWAIRWCYNQFRNNMLTVYPVKSLVSNYGNDLSGVHGSITNKYDVTLYEDEIKIDSNVVLNYDILKNFKQFYDLTILGYVAIIIKKAGLYRPARKLRNKLLKAYRS